MKAIVIPSSNNTSSKMFHSSLKAEYASLISFIFQEEEQEGNSEGKCLLKKIFGGQLESGKKCSFTFLGYWTYWRKTRRGEDKRRTTTFHSKRISVFSHVWHGLVCEEVMIFLFFQGLCSIDSLLALLRAKSRNNSEKMKRKRKLAKASKERRRRNVSVHHHHLRWRHFYLFGHDLRK